MDRRLGGVAGALCAGRWPGLARAADPACAAARPDGDGSLLPPVYAARSHASLTRGSGRHAATNRGYCLPARSAAPIVPPLSGRGGGRAQ